MSFAVAIGVPFIPVAVEGGVPAGDLEFDVRRERGQPEDEQVSSYPTSRDEP
jgi:hypothetical protein